MIVLENFLDEETLKICFNEFYLLEKYSNWKVSDLWNKDLTSELEKSYFQYLNKDLTLRIRNLLICHFQNLRFYEIHCNICKFPVGSGIQKHDDIGYEFGATIYLNKFWNIEFGGILFYQDDNDYKFYIPKFNNLVSLNSGVNHYVTPVTEICTEPRITIQIWAK